MIFHCSGVGLKKSRDTVTTSSAKDMGTFQTQQSRKLRENEGFFSDRLSGGESFRNHCQARTGCITTSIAISGVGTFTFITATRFLVNNVSNGVAFEFDQAPSGADLIIGPTSSAFATWDMLSSIGPISGSGRLLQCSLPFTPVFTNAGQLIFNDGSSPATFQAIVTAVPEPSSLTLVMTG